MIVAQSFVKNSRRLVFGKILKGNFCLPLASTTKNVPRLSGIMHKNPRQTPQTWLQIGKYGLLYFGHGAADVTK